MSGREANGVPGVGGGGGGLRVNGGDDRENPARLGDFSPIVLCCLGGDVKKVYC